VYDTSTSKLTPPIKSNVKTELETPQIELLDKYYKDGKENINFLKDEGDLSDTDTNKALDELEKTHNMVKFIYDEVFNNPSIRNKIDEFISRVSEMKNIYTLEDQRNPIYAQTWWYLSNATSDEF